MGRGRRVFRGRSRDEPRGREAAPLYKLLFVVVLAAASFAGGAAVHSQGPRWAKELIQSQLGGDEADAPTAEGGPGGRRSAHRGRDSVRAAPAAGRRAPPPKRPAKPAAVTPAPAASNGHEAPALPAPEPKAPEPLDPRALGLGDGPSGMKPPTPLAESPGPSAAPLARAARGRAAGPGSAGRAPPSEGSRIGGRDPRRRLPPARLDAPTARQGTRAAIRPPPRRSPPPSPRPPATTRGRLRT